MVNQPFSAELRTNVPTNATSLDLTVHRQAWLKYHNWFALWFAAMVVICIIGATANFLLLLVIRSTRCRLSGSRILITCLVLFEFLSCTVTTPLYSMSVYFAEPAPLSQTFCNYAALLYNGSVRIRHTLEAFLAFNRLFALILPIQYPKIAKRAVVYGMIGFAFSVVIFDLLVFYPVLGIATVSPPFGSCGFMLYPWFGPLYIVNTYIALAFTGVCYVTAMLGVFVKKVMARKVIAPTQGRLAVSMERRVKITAILLSAFSWRTTCFLPAWILVSAYPGLLYTNPTLLFMLRILYVVASATSPVRKAANVYRVLACFWGLGLEKHSLMYDFGRLKDRRPKCTNLM